MGSRISTAAAPQKGSSTRPLEPTGLPSAAELAALEAKDPEAAARRLAGLLEKDAQACVTLLAQVSPALRARASTLVAQDELHSLDAAAKEQRGGFLNGVSDHLLDVFSKKGKTLDRAVHQMDADAADAFDRTPEDGAASSASLVKLSSDFDAVQSALGGYSKMKGTTSQVAGGVLAGAVMLGTGGATGGLFGLVKNPMLAMMLRGTATQMGTKLAIDGKSYVGRPMVQDVVMSTVALSSMMGLRALGTGRRVAALLGGTRLAKSVGGAAEGAVMGGSMALVSGGVSAAMTPGLWSHGVHAGLEAVQQRVEKMAVMSVPFSVATGALLGPLPSYVVPGRAASLGTGTETGDGVMASADPGASDASVSAALNAPARRQTFLRHVIHDLHRIFNMVVMRPPMLGHAAAPNVLPVMLGTGSPRQK